VEKGTYRGAKPAEEPGGSVKVGTTKRTAGLMHGAPSCEKTRGKETLSVCPLFQSKKKGHLERESKASGVPPIFYELGGVERSGGGRGNIESGDTRDKRSVVSGNQDQLDHKDRRETTKREGGGKGIDGGRRGEKRA